MYSDIDELAVREFVPGDLVIFTGNLYSPDFVYVEQFDDKPEYGVIIGPGSAYSNVMYKVYWFNHGRIIDTVAGHMQLAYIAEKDAP